MAVAALSVITVCAAGTAALTGLLPSSKADVPAALAIAPQQTIGAQQAYAAQQSGPSLDAPVARPVSHKATPVHHAQAHAPRHHHTYAAAPVQQARTPNYVAIGTGAVVGGLIGHQIGGGNGKKLATVAGVIGGGFLGNEIANRNR